MDEDKREPTQEPAGQGEEQRTQSQDGSAAVPSQPSPPQDAVQGRTRSQAPPPATAVPEAGATIIDRAAEQPPRRTEGLFTRFRRWVGGLILGSLRTRGLPTDTICDTELSAPALPTLSDYVTKVFRDLEECPLGDNGECVSPLVYSSQYSRGLVSKALREGGFIDYVARDEHGRNRLMYAVVLNNVSDVRFLVRQGVDVNVQDSQGRTALMHAASLRRLDIIEFLIAHGADLELEDNNGATASSLAPDDIVRLVIELAGMKRERSNDGNTFKDDTNKKAKKEIGASRRRSSGSKKESNDGANRRDRRLSTVVERWRQKGHQGGRFYFVFKYPLFNGAAQQSHGVEFAVIPHWAFTDDYEEGGKWRVVAEHLGRGGPNVIVETLGPNPINDDYCRCKKKECQGHVNQPCEKRKRWKQLCSKCGHGYGVSCEHEWWQQRCTRGIQGLNACGMQLAWGCSTAMGLKLGTKELSAAATSEEGTALLCAKISSDFSVVKGRFHAMQNGSYVTLKNDADPHEVVEVPGCDPVDLITLVTKAFGSTPQTDDPVVKLLWTPWPMTDVNAIHIVRVHVQGFEQGGGGGAGAPAEGEGNVHEEEEDDVPDEEQEIEPNAVANLQVHIQLEVGQQLLAPDFAAVAPPAPLPPLSPESQNIIAGVAHLIDGAMAGEGGGGGGGDVQEQDLELHSPVILAIVNGQVSGQQLGVEFGVDSVAATYQAPRAPSWDSFDYAVAQTVVNQESISVSHSLSLTRPPRKGNEEAAHALVIDQEEGDIFNVAMPDSQDTEADMMHFQTETHEESEV